MTWKDIDVKRGRVVISKSKVRSSRIIELAFCPPAQKWMALAKRLKARLPIPFQTRRRRLRRLKAVLHLPKWHQDILRHTAASNLLAYHQDAGKVAAFLGNSAGMLLRHYRALIFREDAEKWMSLNPRPRRRLRLPGA